MAVETQSSVTTFLRDFLRDFLGLVLFLRALARAKEMKSVMDRLMAPENISSQNAIRNPVVHREFFSSSSSWVKHTKRMSHIYWNGFSLIYHQSIFGRSVGPSVGSTHLASVALAHSASHKRVWHQALLFLQKWLKGNLHHCSCLATRHLNRHVSGLVPKINYTRKVQFWAGIFFFQKW